MELEEFTDDQRLTVLNWLIFKRDTGYSLDQVIEEIETPLELEC